MYYKTPSSAEKLVVELVASSACDNPCVVPYIYLDGKLATPHCDMTLAEALAAYIPLNHERIAADILEGANALHGRGIIHGNICPDHVLLRNTPIGVRASLCGLSGAQFNTPTKHNQAYIHPYRAPEVDNDGTLRLCNFTPAADMYAIGVLMYKLRYPHGRVFTRRVIDQHECSVKFYEMAIIGKSSCVHACANERVHDNAREHMRDHAREHMRTRPCTRVPAVLPIEISMSLECAHGSRDMYDSVMISLLAPNPAKRPSSEAALTILAGPAGLAAPRRMVLRTCDANMDAGVIRENIKKYNCDDNVINFIIECLNNRGKFTVVTPEFSDKVAMAIRECVAWFITGWRM